MDRKEVFSRICNKAGKVLFAIARGRDMTKLDIKKETALSMSTVLSSVEKWRRLKYITLEKEEMKSGGKPHSRINTVKDRVAYGVSYKGGELIACAVDLRGEKLGECALRVEDGSVAPNRYVERVTEDLAASCPSPIAVAVAVNSASVSEMKAALEAKYHAPCLLTSNVEAVAYRLLWRDVAAPLCVIGVGNRVKCAYIGETRRVLDLGVLLSPVSACGEERRYERILGASVVAKCLAEKKFTSFYESEGSRSVRITSVGEYSRMLARSVASLVSTVNVLLAPKAICLFGEYLRAGFFERIRAESDCANVLFTESVSHGDLAYATALLALTEGVFNQ